MSSWRWFLEALFPERCIICKREGSWFCVQHNKFPEAPGNEAEFKDLDEIYAATAYYDPTVKKTVDFFKFRGFDSLANRLGEEIAAKVPKEVFVHAVLVPIPLHWTRKLWRGFNQADKIAEALQKKFPHCEICHDLKRVKRTQQQAILGKKERHYNLKEAFIWNGKFIPQKVILIDDVIASGVTIDEAAAACKKAKIENVTGVVFARGGKPCENSGNEN